MTDIELQMPLPDLPREELLQLGFAPEEIDRANQAYGIESWEDTRAHMMRLYFAIEQMETRITTLELCNKYLMSRLTATAPPCDQK